MTEEDPATTPASLDVDTEQDRLLRVEDLVVEYPTKGFRAKPFRALTDINSHQARARPLAWSANQARVRPPWAEQFSAWPQSPPERSSSKATTSATPRARSGES